MSLLEKEVVVWKLADAVAEVWGQFWNPEE
jgi:hypothetical protein